MVFNDTNNKLGMIQYAEQLCGFDDGGISGTDTLCKQFTGLLNSIYREIVAKIWRVQGGWEFDDRNLSTVPVATTDLVADQQDYELPSTAQQIQRVEILDSDGNYQVISPIDKSQISDEAMTEYLETAGMPEQYDMVGRSIFLYPKPSSSDVTTTAGLKIYVARDIDAFTSSDTTQEPGFVNNFHALIPLGASKRYAVGKSMWNTVNACQKDMDLMERDFEEFYSRRNKNVKVRISPSMEQYT